jgi:hypothetical protein
MDSNFLEASLPHDAVERVRAIRDRHYEETKHMTREEKRAHDSAKMAEAVAEFKKLAKEANPDDYDFSWLRSKEEEKSVDNDPTDDAVEMIRAIRDRHYEEVKHMTREEQRAYVKERTAKGAAAFKERLANAKPDYERFPFLAKR